MIILLLFPQMVLVGCPLLIYYSNHLKKIWNIGHTGMIPDDSNLNAFDAMNLVTHNQISSINELTKGLIVSVLSFVFGWFFCWMEIWCWYQELEMSIASHSIFHLHTSHTCWFLTSGTDHSKEFTVCLSGTYEGSISALFICKYWNCNIVLG